MFDKINHKGLTTFYDSVCGLPLFKVPQNRTFEEFKAETVEHGMYVCIYVIVGSICVYITHTHLE